jgi:hypothetical protein
MTVKGAPRTQRTVPGNRARCLAIKPKFEAAVRALAGATRRQTSQDAGETSLISEEDGKQKASRIGEGDCEYDDRLGPPQDDEDERHEPASEKEPPNDWVDDKPRDEGDGAGERLQDDCHEQG